MNSSGNQDAADSDQPSQANALKKLWAENYSKQTFIRDWNASVQRAKTEFPLGLKLLCTFKLLTYFISWFMTLNTFLGLNQQALTQWQVWRYATSPLLAKSIFWDFWFMVWYGSLLGYEREHHRGTLASIIEISSILFASQFIGLALSVLAIGKVYFEYTFVLLILYDFYCCYARGDKRDQPLYLIFCEPPRKYAALILLLLVCIILHSTNTDYIFYCTIPLIEIVSRIIDKGNLATSSNMAMAIEQRLPQIVMSIPSYITAKEGIRNKQMDANEIEGFDRRTTQPSQMRLKTGFQAMSTNKESQIGQIKPEQAAATTGATQSHRERMAELREAQLKRRAQLLEQQTVSAQDNNKEEKAKLLGDQDESIDVDDTPEKATSIRQDTLIDEEE